MPSFKDSQDREWDLSLNITSAKRVRDRCDVNLLKILDSPDLLSDLADDPILFVDVIWVMVQPQAMEAGVTDEQFGEAMAGHAIEQATEAFLGALVDFFQGARKETLRRVLTRATKRINEQEASMQELINNGTLDRALDEALIPSTTSSESPEPRESPPAP